MNRFILCVMSSICMIILFQTASAQLKEPMIYPMNYYYLGLENTNTSSYNGSTMNGYGLMAGGRVSFMGDLENDDSSRVYFADITSLDVGFGKRTMNAVTIAHNNLKVDGAYFSFTFNFGFQAFYRITENADLGGQLYYNANYDDARAAISGEGGNDDNVLWGIHARYDRLIFEYSTRVPKFYKGYFETQDAKSYRLYYVYDKKHKKSIALSYDYFSAYDINIITSMQSSNIRLVWISAL